MTQYTNSEFWFCLLPSTCKSFKPQLWCACHFSFSLIYSSQHTHVSIVFQILTGIQYITIFISSLSFMTCILFPFSIISADINNLMHLPF